MTQCYRRLMAITQRVVGQARRFVREVIQGLRGASVGEIGSSCSAIGFTSRQ